MYRLIHLVSLIPETLPGVSLFIRHGDNYVLYKENSLQFTAKDKVRLLDNNVRYLYVKSDEMSMYNQYVESNLPRLMTDERLEPQVRQNILYEASVNYVEEIFDRPAIAIRQNVDRCRRLLEVILSDVMNSDGVMTALSSLVDHNAYTYVHSVQVATYSIALHIKMFDLSRDELLDVGIGSLFHDYGKVYIPKNLLEKPGKLTPVEFMELKKHPDYGYNTLKDLDIFSPVSLGIVRHHHEKENGTGYPDGLTSYDIARSSKVTAIADVFSALTTNRSYRSAFRRSRRSRSCTERWTAPSTSSISIPSDRRCSWTPRQLSLCRLYPPLYRLLPDKSYSPIDLLLNLINPTSPAEYRTELSPIKRYCHSRSVSDRESRL